MSPKKDERERTQGGGDLSRFYRVLVGVAVVGVVAIAYSVFSGQAASGVAAPVDIGALQGLELRNASKAVRVGSADAPIVIMEFGDYQCPACAEFAALVKPAIIRDLVETGRAALEFRDYPLIDIHPNSFLAARAAHCADDQGQFWAFHDRLFGAQSRWSTAGDPSGQFNDIADEVGLDAGTFSTCLNGDAHAAAVTANLMFAQALQLPGTPSIVVQQAGGGAIRLPSYDYRTILAAVEELERPAGGEGGDPAGGGD